jgi:site-specific DNA recombinase
MTTKGLRFAALVRVSTDKQEKKGESMNTQTIRLTDAVKRLNGTVYDWYKGQEGAGPEAEREQLERLMTDAQQEKFDAIMVDDISRWSRDNKKNEEYLDILAAHQVRFFALDMEFNLFNPEQRFILTNVVGIGQFFRNLQAYKSIINRVERAKKGYPSGGKSPFGRIFDREKEEWGVIPEKQKLVRTLADEYLNGGTGFVPLGRKYGMTAERVWRILTQRSGSDWPQRFTNAKFGIDITVNTKIPALLPPETIEAIKTKAYNNRTWDQKPMKEYTYKGKLRKCQTYILGKRIWDAKSGYAMVGATVNDTRYYRMQGIDRKKETIPKCFNVRADDIEASVMEQLFSLMDAQVAKGAVEAASPSAKERVELESRKGYYQKTYNECRRKIKRLIDLVEVGGEREMAEALKRIPELTRQTEALEEDIKKVDCALSVLPTEAEVEAKRKGWESIVKHLNLLDRYKGNGLGYEMKRKLVRLFFNGSAPDGRKFGVYVHYHPPNDGQRKPTFSYSAYGVFGDLYGEMNGDGNWWPKEGGREANGAMIGELEKHHSKIKPFYAGINNEK